MVFKVNIGTKEGKTYKTETDNEILIGKKIGEVINGSEVSNDLNGYELEIKGTSDKAGFAGIKSESGPNLRKVMFTKGPFFKKVKNKGVRKKKSVRGNEVSLNTVQINVVVKKVGSKWLDEIFKKEEPKEEAASEVAIK